MQLDVILRTHDQGSIHGRDVTYSKKEMVRRCATSLFSALEDVDANLTIVDDHSSDDTLRLLETHGELIHLEGNGNNASLQKVFELAKASTADAVYLVEDDYLHFPYAVSEMLETWEMFVPLIGTPDICMDLVDCPYNYCRPKDGSQCQIVGGVNRAWRTNVHTGGTFCTTPAVINKHWEAFDCLSKYWPHVDENATWNRVWEKHVPLFTPLIPLAYHLSARHPYHPFDELWEASKGENHARLRAV